MNLTVGWSFAICVIVQTSEMHFQPLVPFPDIPDRGLSAILAREPAKAAAQRVMLQLYAIVTPSL